MDVAVEVHVCDRHYRRVGVPVVDVASRRSEGGLADGESVGLSVVFRKVLHPPQEGGFEPAGDDQPGLRDMGDGGQVCVHGSVLPAVDDRIASGVNSDVLVGPVRQGSMRPAGVVIGVRSVIDIFGAAVGGIQAHPGAYCLDFREIRGHFEAIALDITAVALLA